MPGPAPLRAEVGARLAALRARIAAGGRNPAEVTVVAVTKGHPVEACRAALACGLTRLGENRVQEALAKIEALGPGAGAEWHLVGHLQSNKARRAAGRFSLIQSIDALRLAELLAAEAPGQRVLVEVNTAREARKSGCPPELAADLIDRVAALLPLEGLMCMGPLDGDPRPAFAELRRIRDRAQERLGRALPVLSMGMSGDLEAALAEGSTMVRVGTALFGPRPRVG